MYNPTQAIITQALPVTVVEQVESQVSHKIVRDYLASGNLVFFFQMVGNVVRAVEVRGLNAP
jgi:hypothetical protein